jgi:L-alanine-DL-glutamate epimerase-like enolase superfamily enzyme
LNEHLIPLLIGRDPRKIKGSLAIPFADWRRGPVTMTAIAAVDKARWDNKSKSALGTPLYQLFGGLLALGMPAEAMLKRP